MQFLCVSVPRICSDFNTIRDKVMSVPESTDDMAQMSDYINVCKTKTTADLNEKIEVDVGFIIMLHLTHKNILYGDVSYLKM